MLYMFVVVVVVRVKFFKIVVCMFSANFVIQIRAKYGKLPRNICIYNEIMLLYFNEFGIKTFLICSMLC